LIKEFWSPHIAGEFNENYIKFAKIKGEFIWYHHKDEDEMFLVIKGKFDMHLKTEKFGKTVENILTINEGEFIVIPKGVEHKPVAKEEVHLLLIEPKTTINTGNEKNSKLTKTNLKTI